MKKVLSRLLAVSLSFMVAFGLLIVPATESANADGAVLSVAKYAKTVKYHTGATYSDVVVLDMGSKLKGAKSVKVTSSKKSVVKPFSYDKSWGGGLLLNIKKKGTAKLTIKVRKGSKTKKYKVKVKVVKYKNPFKTFKVGKKNFASKFKKSMIADYHNSLGSKQKVSVKLSGGKKLRKITYYAFNYESDKEITKNIKNNSTIKLIKDTQNTTEWLTVVDYDTKTKTTSSYILYL